MLDKSPGKLHGVSHSGRGVTFAHSVKPAIPEKKTVLMKKFKEHGLLYQSMARNYNSKYKLIYLSKNLEKKLLFKT